MLPCQAADGVGVGTVSYIYAPSAHTCGLRRTNSLLPSELNWGPAFYPVLRVQPRRTRGERGARNRMNKEM